ncbi:MAG: beta-N-acetylhexosaminidase [Acidimicrobiales bacterium]|nr:beta-N-acetylhexosaminidase [Acidimicrobiales bacterium]
MNPASRRETPAVLTGRLDAVVPLPLEVLPAPGQFHLTAATTVAAVDDAASDAVALLRRRVAPLPSATAAAAGRHDRPPSSIVLTSDEADPALGPEGYRLRIGTERIEVVAGGHDGFLWAVQTLRQLMPPELGDAGVPPDGVAVPCASIHDAPRYPWRGAMLDVARHFFSPADVCSVTELLAAYKLNRLHLHLTDDQGWRIEVRAHPELATVGGQTAVDGGPGGAYTQADLTAIVEHARRLGVTVVPEVDVPGHTNAALSALGWLSCDGEPRPPYTGTHVGFSSLCVEEERTYGWLDDVIGELAALTPGAWIHLGGDESAATDAEAYRGFVTRALDLVRAHGKVPVGWGEIGAAELGGPTVVQHWFDPRPTLAAAAQGAGIVLSPADRTYLDQKYDESTPVGVTWMGAITTERAYAWDPARSIEGLDPDRILGIEAPLWTETISTRAEVERMLVPRLPALAEVAWTSEASREWRSFAARLAGHRGRWDADGIAWTADPSVAGLA